MNVACSMKGTVDSKKMGKNPKCVNVKKVALYQKGYKCLLDWSLNPNHIYIGRCMEHYVKGARGSKWQNPFTVSRYGLEKCTELYKETRPEVYSSDTVSVGTIRESSETIRESSETIRESSETIRDHEGIIRDH